jgi:tRNA A37 threonylcarbamoyladenosine dehydratase
MVRTGSLDSLCSSRLASDMIKDLILEQLNRNRVFLTDDGLSKLRSAFVIIVGCGGVGSHATAALARSGVSKMRLIDFDQVTLSSLNRHAVATLADVGTPKVHCLRRRLEQITPWVHFECRNELFGASTAEAQLSDMNGQAPDFVIDAIDNIDSKVALLNYCAKNKLNVISSMGAGCKSDPTKILIGDISNSTDDRLSKSTRRKLRALGVKDGIPVVFSTEKAGPGKAELLPISEEEFAKGKVGELGVLPDFRIRILPVLGTMPAIFGLIVANHAILEITGYPHEYLPSKARDKMYDSILGGLQAAEERLAKSMGHQSQGLKIGISKDDVGYLVEEVFLGRSIVSGLFSRLALVRWNRPSKNIIDPTTPGQMNTFLTLKDLVCMTKEEAQRHERKVLKGDKRPEDLYDQKVVEHAQRRMKEAERFEKLRFESED